jgi:hypothetical protein
MLVETVTQQMPRRVLKKHNIVLEENNDYSLKISEITISQRAELISLCEQKISEYTQKSGVERKINRRCYSTLCSKIH